MNKNQAAQKENKFGKIIKNEFKRIKIQKTVPFEGRTLYLSEIDIDGAFHLDCIKGDKLIRATIHMPEAGYQFEISFSSEEVSEEAMVEIENRLRNCKSLYNKDYKTFMADLVTIFKSVNL
ncbi:hypothetical protein [uncultured Ruminococcus sp.]|uniref:hypothetical protein n=1 Tax=uncultured Ruminococcus sp. TaxID=165186 RepID=UPI0026124F22|nr:hypothetical protein [uncultured Ruminococcus sp.]